MKYAILLYALFIGFVLWLGGFCVNYTLLHTVHKTLPFVWAIVVSVVTGEASVVIAVVVKALVLLGVIA